MNSVGQRTFCEPRDWEILGGGLYSQPERERYIFPNELVFRSRKAGGNLKTTSCSYRLAVEVLSLEFCFSEYLCFPQERDLFALPITDLGGTLISANAIPTPSLYLKTWTHVHLVHPWSPAFSLVNGRSSHLLDKWVLWTSWAHLCPLAIASRINHSENPTLLPFCSSLLLPPLVMGMKEKGICSQQCWELDIYRLIKSLATPFIHIFTNRETGQDDDSHTAKWQMRLWARLPDLWWLGQTASKINSSKLLQGGL